jgi:methylamine dehydrogenase accessory protein MauD
VRSFAHAERFSVGVVLASDGEVEDHRAYVARNNLGALPYVVSGALGLAYGVSKLPYAVAIDRKGIVRAKGLVNSREHLESLVNALETGTASLQEWLTRASADAAIQ